MKTIATTAIAVLVVLCTIPGKTQTRVSKDTTPCSESHVFPTNDPFRVFFSTGVTMVYGEVWEGAGIGAGSSKVWFEGGVISSKFCNDVYVYLLGQHLITHVAKAEAYIGLSANVKCDRTAAVGLEPLLKTVYNCDKNVSLYAQLGFGLSQWDNYKVHNPGFGLGINIWLKRYDK